MFMIPRNTLSAALAATITIVAVTAALVGVNGSAAATTGDTGPNSGECTTARAVEFRLQAVVDTAVKALNNPPGVLIEGADLAASLAELVRRDVTKLTDDDKKLIEELEAAIKAKADLAAAVTGRVLACAEPTPTTTPSPTTTTAPPTTTTTRPADRDHDAFPRGGVDTGDGSTVITS